jgi:PAS domain S-box-containing protein
LALIFNQTFREFPPLLAHPQRGSLQLSIIGFLALGIFIADWFTPVGIGIGILYISVVLATFPLQNILVTKGAIGTSIVLVLLGYWISPPGFGQEIAIINRWVSIFCIIITGFMVLKNVSARHALQNLQKNLETKFGLQTKTLKEQNRATLNLLDDIERVKHHLEDKERRLRLLIDAFPSGMLIVDHLGKVVFANKLIEILFGYSENELIGQSIDWLVPKRFQQEHSQHRAGFLHDPTARAMGAGRDLFACRKDGSEFPVEIGLNPINTPEGLIVLSSVVDITARKQSEAELERLNQQLRTQNQELEAYAYAVSHDLRAPLRAVHNYADFLLEDLSFKVSTEQKEYLTGITTAVCEAEELVSDLLELSRLNVQDSASHVCHIGNLVHKVLRTLNFGKDVHVQLPVDWPIVLGQEHLLKQIFQNLISNGVKFNRSSQKHIEVDWRPERKRFVRFFIRDNGIGILPQYQKQIFQIFQRLHTTKDYEGTGIGLAIVKKAVTKLGGEVSVESETGKGSIFSFTVPMGEMHDDE